MDIAEKKTPGSGLPAPAGASEEWTPAQQIARVLGLCETQMGSALNDADVAMQTLVESFTSVAKSARSMQALAMAMPQTVQAPAAELCEQLDSMNQQLVAAVIAFQFYDKLTQRLGHVRYSLSSLADFVCDSTQSTQRKQWDGLLRTLEQLYRTEEERQIFKRMVQTGPRQPAPASTAPRPAACGDIELF